MKKEAKIGILGIIGFIVLLIIFGSFEIVDSGYKGLRFTMGKLSEEILDEGVAWKVPFFQSIKEISIRPIQMDYEIAVGNDGAITKDNQNIGASMTLFYRYNPTKLVELWRKVGLEKLQSINASKMKEAFKAEIGKYTIFDVAPIQEDIRKDMLVNLRESLSIYPEEITELRITNYDWPDSFEKQIEETMKMAQKVKQKQQDLLVTEQEAQKQVKLAEAQKESMVTVAVGKRDAAKLEAEAKALQGEGIRKYNEEIAKNIEIEIKIRQLEIEKIKAEKWNGINVPNNVYSPIPVSYGGVQGVSQPQVKN